MLIIPVVALILLVSACSRGSNTAHSLTITFKDNQCSYNDAQAVAAGELSLTMDVKQEGSDSGLVILTLDPGKSLADLKAWPSNYSDPPWSHRAGEAPRYVHLGERYTFKATIQNGPIYLVCFSGPPAVPIGVLGPIEVRK
jgi:hypothetical protein